MANTWFSQVESTVFTYINYMMVEKSDAPYPDLNCTTKSQSKTPSQFPTLYLHVLTPAEQAQDFENNEVNALLATIEIQVFSNQTEQEANDIITTAISFMKDLQWNVTMFPNPQTNGNVSFAIARFRKLVIKKNVTA